mmetsp:Transcript_20695/g.31633  ORF Transcript_20695/g.31633 Transcript_20695/m.31633 type:complete len:403 (+) Transcript_20695:223-1431(+)
MKMIRIHATPSSLIVVLVAVLHYLPSMLHILRLQIAVAAMTISQNAKHQHPAVSAATPIMIPWARAKIDYSGANEYIAAHYYYNSTENFSDPYYFATGPVVEENIFNARNGVRTHYCEHMSTALTDATLDSCGFALVEHPNQYYDDSTTSTAGNCTKCWQNLGHVQAYVNDLRRCIIPQAFEDQDDNIMECIFWNPVLRGEDLSMSSRRDDHANSSSTITTSSVAGMVHIDNDIGAYPDEESVVDLVLKNRVVISRDGDDLDDEQTKRDRMVKLLRSGHRFVVLNIWRNVGDLPVRSAPLGILATRYTTELAAFPDGVFNQRESFWYCFPEMQPHEYLLFKQNDRDVMFPSDLWHCALTSMSFIGGGYDDEQMMTMMMTMRMMMTMMMTKFKVTAQIIDVFD